MKNLGEIAEKQGVTILTGTELLTDESGTVCGVKAISNGDNLNIYAKKVILAADCLTISKPPTGVNYFQGLSQNCLRIVIQRNEVTKDLSFEDFYKLLRKDSSLCSG